MAVEHEYLFHEIWNDWIHKDISDEDFDLATENYVLNFMSDVDLDCLNNRKDNRSYGEFFRQVNLKTHRQNALMGVWAGQMFLRKHTIKFKDNGVDNSGRPILSMSQLNKNADYVVSIDNKPFVPVELKEATRANISLKVSDLRCFIQQESCILIFWKTGNRKSQKIRKCAEWALFGTTTLKSMLTWPFRKYENINGGKLSVLIKPEDYGKLFDIYSLFDDSIFHGISNKQVQHLGGK